MPTLELVEVPVDEDEMFLSQVWKKLCSPDCNSLASKLVKMLSSGDILMSWQHVIQQMITELMIMLFIALK